MSLFIELRAAQVEFCFAKRQAQKSAGADFCA
jgi:hypothetical protein